MMLGLHMHHIGARRSELPIHEVDNKRQGCWEEHRVTLKDRNKLVFDVLEVQVPCHDSTAEPNMVNDDHSLIG